MTTSYKIKTVIFKGQSYKLIRKDDKIDVIKVIDIFQIKPVKKIIKNQFEWIDSIERVQS